MKRTLFYFELFPLVDFECEVGTVFILCDHTDPPFNVKYRDHTTFKRSLLCGI